MGSTAPERGGADTAEAEVSAAVARPSLLDSETLSDRPVDARRVLVVEPDPGTRSLIAYGLT
ncbi:MAG: hypothetical protein ACXWK4_08255, partial [Myxococcaceae bacterium]